MCSQIETIVNVYKTLSKIPSIVSGRITHGGGGRSVSCTWSIRNLDRGKSVKYVCQYVLDDSLKVLATSDFGTDVTNEVLSCISPSEKYKAVIREEKEKDTKKFYLEVWSAASLVQSIDLTALELHGDVYADSEFGCLNWSHDESAVCYVAERKPAKTEPYVKRRPQCDSDKDAGDAPPAKGEEYVYRQDWGEQLVGKRLSVGVKCAVQDERLILLEGLPEDYCPGQVCFTPNGDTVGVSWRTEPRRFGLIFCTNRPGFVFKLTPQGHLTQLSGEGLAVRSPRVSRSGTVVWLQRAEGGPHHGALQLAVWTHGCKEPSVIIDIVDTEVKTSNGQPFHGIYCQALPGRCFSADGTRLVFSSPQRDEVRSYVVDLDDGRLVDISHKKWAGSTTVLDVHDDILLAVCSSITSPHQLYIRRLGARGEEGVIEWQPLSEPTAAPPGLNSAIVQYMHLEHPHCQEDVKSFSAIYCAPARAGDKRVPVVLWPHGGPHSNFVNAYSLEAAFFTLLGLAWVQVNYRGSSGAGQLALRFLPGRAGQADVADCKLAAEQVLARHPVDPRNVFVFGGSHGGFLACHLSGQHPELFRAVVTRNPVVDVASMANSTDIPDWCAVEAGFEFSERGAPSEEQLLRMRRCSPLVHAHRVAAPTALMLGGKDKRVPHYQGLEYARRLKANGVETKVYMYDDNHSLSSLPSEMDNLINSARWFLEHMHQ